jgi:hypothetical protein
MGIKLRRTMWEEFVASAGNRNMCRIYRVLVGKHEGKNRVDDIDIDGIIVLECALNK